ncbi:hypothetical protein BDK51DRAFT_39557 [Blyttiomyces helicus]|uniref:Uncharacterized protein n=1 Tax=Blyttiomyces helicus TaxID=388810 RepID=A0A4P9W0G3_9FUNG|nr:hypothetical protein BDK51DRAFT_39557 [Blyttiomyces helicus]|eukprot:RKO85574.1 hypothetical protein BDK51DRAFT_39557 [Blyttiomyces helicus]
MSTFIEYRESTPFAPAFPAYTHLQRGLAASHAMAALHLMTLPAVDIFRIWKLAEMGKTQTQVRNPESISDAGKGHVIGLCAGCRSEDVIEARPRSSENLTTLCSHSHSLLPTSELCTHPVTRAQLCSLHLANALPPSITTHVRFKPTTLPLRNMGAHPSMSAAPVYQTGYGPQLYQQYQGGYPQQQYQAGFPPQQSRAQQGGYGSQAPPYPYYQQPQTTAPRGGGCAASFMGCLAALCCCVLTESSPQSDRTRDPTSQCSPIPNKPELELPNIGRRNRAKVVESPRADLLPLSGPEHFLVLSELGTVRKTDYGLSSDSEHYEDTQEALMESGYGRRPLGIAPNPWDFIRFLVDAGFSKKRAVNVAFNDDTESSMSATHDLSATPAHLPLRPSSTIPITSGPARKCEGEGCRQREKRRKSIRSSQS